MRRFKAFDEKTICWYVEGDGCTELCMNVATEFPETRMDEVLHDMPNLEIRFANENRSLNPYGSCFCPHCSTPPLIGM